MIKKNKVKEQESWKFIQNQSQIISSVLDKGLGLYMSKDMMKKSFNEVNN